MSRRNAEGLTVTSKLLRCVMKERPRGQAGYQLG